MDPSVTTVTSVTALTTRPVAIRIAAALAGAIGVALAAQIAIPIPGSPVPFTMQPMAVLIVGGLLGARFGALSLTMYLVMDAAGLPVFAPIGAPGIARLFGPTAGYLLSYPVVAAVVGLLVRRVENPTLHRCIGAALVGMVIVFIGGLSGLAIYSRGQSIAFGLSPFAAVDLLKVFLAALVIRRFAASTRALS